MIAEQGPSCNAEETFSRLVAEYQKPLLHMCAMMLRDDAAAEDAVQETFVKAWRALPQFRGACSEKSWLMRIAVNTCRDMQRGSWFRHIDRRVSPENLPEPAVQPTDDHVELTLALMNLPRKLREALMLYYYQDMSTTEIAETLGIAQSSVSNRLRRGRDALRKALERREDHA